jgi:hypothetical protein
MIFLNQSGMGRFGSDGKLDNGDYWSTSQVIFCLFNINDLKLHFVVFEKVAAFLSAQNNGRKFE